MIINPIDMIEISPVIENSGRLCCAVVLDKLQAVFPDVLNIFREAAGLALAL